MFEKSMMMSKEFKVKMGAKGKMVAICFDDV